MDLAGGLRRGVSDPDGPGAGLLAARGEEALEAQELVACPDDAVESRLLKPEVLHELLPVSLVHASELRLGLGADGNNDCSLGLGDALHDVQVLVVLEAVIGDVRDVHDRLQGKELQVADDVLLGVGELQRAEHLAVGELGVALVEDGVLLDSLLVSALCLPDDAVPRLLADIEIGERELDVDGVDVIGGIDAAVHVDDVLVLEAAYHVGDGVSLADVLQELVAESLALGGALHKSRDVDELHGGGNDLLRVVDGGKLIEPVIGNRHYAGVGIDCAERKVLSRDAGFG